MRCTILQFVSILLVIASLSSILAAGCSQQSDKPAESKIAGAAIPREDGPTAKDYPALPNLLQITDTIFSGGEPKNNEAFAALARLGIKTVVSVDGARPNLDAARAHGLQYVHIPIGYDGIDDEAGLSLAGLVRDGVGPFYIHCHHGRHRGPAAAAVACIAAGDTDSQGALGILERSGTSKDYNGLWRDVENYEAPSADVQLPELREVAEMGSIAAAMAAMDRAYDNLKLCRDARWATPDKHPDLVPAQQALLVKEGLHEMGRNLAGDYDDDFKTRLNSAKGLAQNLEDALKNQDIYTATQRFHSLATSCKSCHETYRN